MRKNLLFLSLILLFSASTFAQSISLKVKGNIVNSGTLFPSGIASDVAIAQKVDVENISGSALDIQCRRYELDVVPGTKNFYCWFICYTNAVTGTNPHSVSTHFLTIPAGGSVNNVFAADHEPDGTIGVSKYRYVWFDKNNPNDSAWVDMHFAVTLTGVSEIQNSTKMEIYPNPASDKVTLNFNNSKGFKVDKVRIINALGLVVKTVDLESNSKGNAGIDLSALNNGVYFFTLFGEKGIFGTRRLVISK